MKNVQLLLGNAGIVPVIEINAISQAIPLAEALVRSHLALAEIDFSKPNAAEFIKKITGALPELTIGAGSIINEDQAEKAIQAGAEFVVTPGVNESVIDYCISKDITVFPGINTPSEIEKALEKGLKNFNIFPAEQSGGIKSIEALAGVYPGVSFFPHGGISPSNINDYLSSGAVLCCGGNWIIKQELIDLQDFGTIEENCNEAAFQAHGFEFAHFALNSADEKTAAERAQSFSQCFALPVADGPRSLFASDKIEINKFMGYGEYGHIAIRTNSLNRALAFLEKQGIKQMGDFVFVGDKAVAVYIDKDFGGFAVHLLQR